MADSILKSLEDHLKYCYESNRKDTFKKWVFSEQASCSASKLAEAGFIFTGSKADPDSVKCFLCNKSLDCWDEDDDPWAEHQKHAPDCSFAKMDKPEKSFTLSEFLDIRNEVVETFLRNALMENVDKSFESLDDVIHMIKVTK